MENIPVATHHILEYCSRECWTASCNSNTLGLGAARQREGLDHWRALEWESGCYHYQVQEVWLLQADN